MGITNINNGQKVSPPITSTPGASRGLSAPDGGIPKVGCGCNSGGNPFFSIDSYVRLDLVIDAALKAIKPQAKPMPRKIPVRWKIPSWMIPY